MTLLNNLRLRHAGLILAATVMLGSPVSAQTAIKFSLDFKFEGPAAPFVVALCPRQTASDRLHSRARLPLASLRLLTRIAPGGSGGGLSSATGIQGRLTNAYRSASAT